MRPKKRSLTIRGHRTSIALEDELWEDFQFIAKSRNCSTASLAADIDSERVDSGRSLSSAIRIFILQYWKNKAV